MHTSTIRNFSIIAHIDHGKSTLADRLLQITGTIPERKMREQVLDSMELERERGITIKLAPVRMKYRIDQGKFDRRNTQKETQNDAEFLYKDLTYKIRGILFKVRSNLGLGHKEQVYHNALEIEFKKAGILFESKKNIAINYDGKSIGTYQPDFIVEKKILIELKALPEIGKPQIEQVWSYLKGCEYKLALLVNYGSKDLDIKRVIYDTARVSSALSASSLRVSAGVSDQIEEYVLNLIDTPGHIDFSYEVSRSLKAVEGAILLVDATQGVQAQTLTTLAMAQELGLVIVPVITKIDSNLARVEDTATEIVTLLKCERASILCVSGKTGEGVDTLLAAIVERIPPPVTSQNDPENDSVVEASADSTQTIAEKNDFAVSASVRGSSAFSASSLRNSAGDQSLQALVFDFEYSPHRGVVVYVRVFGGEIKKGSSLLFGVTRETFQSLEVGVFSPEQVARDVLGPGEIGYVVTGLKEPGKALVGDTITTARNESPVLSGYRHPQPVVWASLYPESQDEFTALRQALTRLKLSDSSLSFEEEMSGTLGRGFRCGFLGMLHLEIVVERLKREYNLELILTAPSIVYEAEFAKEWRKKIYSPAQFPGDGTYTAVYEPWAKINIITPLAKVGDIIQLLYAHEAEVGESETFSNDRVRLEALIPLRELMRGFFDEMKSVSSGYASFSYEPEGMKKADVTRLDVLVAEELVPAFSQIVSKHKAYEEAKKVVERLYNLLPPQLFPVKIQGVAHGRILSSKTISALKKDVTGYLYGGDITRKRKLWEKQKKGKKKLKERGKVNIPHDVFLKMVKGE